MRRFAAAAFAAALFSAGAAVAQSKGSDQNDAAWTQYFQAHQLQNAPMSTDEFAMGATVPASVTVYEFRDRPEWRDYRFFYSGGRYYVIDADRKVVRAIEMKKGS